MRIFLCDAGNIPQDVLKKAARILPEGRVPREDIRADAYAARVIGTLLAHYAIKQISPETVCEKWLVAESGKPYIESCPVHFNISHASGIVAVAVSKSTPVGIDIEQLRQMRKGFAARYFNEAEQAVLRDANSPDEALIRLWTAKEAVGKQHGTGLGKNIPAIDTQEAMHTVLERNGTRYALSIAPKCALPPLEWVDFSKLVP